MCINVPYCTILLVGSGLLASNHHLVLCQDPSRNRQFWITLNIPLVVSKCKTDAHQAGSMVLDLVGGFKTRRGEEARGDLFGHDLLGDDWWCNVQQLLVAQLDTFLFLSKFYWRQHWWTPFLQTTKSIHHSWLQIESSYPYHTLGHRFCSPFKCSTWAGLAFVFKRYMLCEIIFTVRWRLHLFDWTSERVLNWHGWFLWLVGVTMPAAHSPAKSAYVQIVKQNLVNKLVGVTPCHLPFLSIFVLVRSVVTL